MQYFEGGNPMMKKLPDTDEVSDDELLSWRVMDNAIAHEPTTAPTGTPPAAPMTTPTASSIGGTVTGLDYGETIALSLDGGSPKYVLPDEGGKFSLPGTIDIGDDYTVTIP